MLRTSSFRAPAILAILLASAPESLAENEVPRVAVTENVRAVFTQVRGAVTLTFPQAGRGVRIARALQVIPRGAMITVPADATAALVCSTNHQILLEDRSQWSLTQAACTQGRALSPDSYFRIAPRGGRLLSVGALIAVERSSRGVTGDRRTPVLLSPRNTAVLESRPMLRWTAVTAASEYQIELLGRRGSFVERLPADEVDCAPDSDAWADADVCVAPYPSGHPDLEVGEIYFLTIGAREGIASPLHKAHYGERLHRLNAQQADKVKKAVESLRSLQLDEVARWVMLAGIYTEHGLLAGAIEAYRHALALESTAEIRVGLGDAYLLTDLVAAAAHSYRAAGEANDEPDVEAAVAFGLGQSQLVRRRYVEALDLFHRARERYNQSGLKEEAKTASRQAAKARARLKR